MWAFTSMPRARPDAMTYPASVEAARQTLGEHEPGARGVSRPHDADDRSRQNLDLAGDGQERRRGVDGAERRRIGRLAGCDEADVELAGAVPFGLAPPRRSRCGSRGTSPCGPGRAEPSSAAAAVLKRPSSEAKVRGPTILAPDQPEPVQLLAVGEIAFAGSSQALAPMRLSVPCISLWRLARCVHHRTSVMAARATPVGDLPGEEEKQRHGHGADQGRRRGEAGREGDAEPDGGEAERTRPPQADEAAEIGGDALAAPEPQPDRIDVAEEGGHAGEDRGAVAEQPAGQEHGRGALQRIGAPA